MVVIMPKNHAKSIISKDLPATSISNEINYRPIEDWMIESTDSIDVIDVDGKAERTSFKDGSSINSISWTCWTNRGNRLFYNGAPFRARCLSWNVSGISWQAGSGWPVYTDYCPQPNYSAGMRFRDAKRHQIVPVFGGHYWVGCAANDSGCGNRTTDVWFWVNDDKYDDNTGVFNLTITGWR